MAPSDTYQQDNRPRIRAGFEFAEMPLTDVAEILRAFAAASLDQLLGKTQQDPGRTLAALSPFLKNRYPGFPGLDRKRRYRLLKTYRRQKKISNRLKARWNRMIHDRRLLALHNIQLKMSALRARRNERRMRLAGRSPDFFRKVVRYSLGSPLSNRARRLMMLERVAWRFFGPDSYVLPNHLWKLAGELAWSDLHFRHRIARDVRIYLRERVVFEPGMLPQVDFSPRTFWLLLAMYKPERVSWWRRLLPGYRNLREVARNMRRVAQREVSGESWALFWDQWLILEVLLKNRKGLLSLKPDLSHAIASLPLIQKTTINWQVTPGHSEESVPLLATPQWGAENVTWLAPLYEPSMWEVSPRV